MAQEQEVMFADFYQLCEVVEAYFDMEWRGAEEWEKEEGREFANSLSILLRTFIPLATTRLISVLQQLSLDASSVKQKGEN